MKEASKQILEQLTDAGYRLTNARREVVRALLCAREPLSVQKIAERVSVDEASVYRTVALLREQKLIEEIIEPGATRRYAVAKGHHHHIVCTDCSRVVHIPCNDKRQVRIRHPEFIDIIDHDVTYYGRCHSCA